MPEIAVQLLIGQNKEPFLPYAIRSVIDWVDYFTVCNTDPNGQTGQENEALIRTEISQDKLRLDNLYPDSHGRFSFADARNTCLSLTDEDDFVFILDADDVHYPHWENIVKDNINAGYDSITAYFYHLMVYKNIYQYVAPREIIYTNYEGTHWEKGVHELLHVERRKPTTAIYHYMHYGYIKPQSEVFSRWKFYSDLEGDFHHYDGQNPNHILDDRVAVCTELPMEHPPVIQDFLKVFPEIDTQDLRQSPPRRGAQGEEKVGLLLLTVNDEEYLDTMFKTLAETEHPPDYSILAIDCNSTDGSLENLKAWEGVLPMEIVQAEEYVSLAEALNYGFDHFRTDETYRYVGWIHPDMQFVQPQWLHHLWKELQEHPKWGKVCAANFRDMIPEEAHRGHEQCYIMRKDILHKIGLFDEQFVGIGGYEDWDFNRRIMEHQGPEGFYEVIITPRAWVLHEGMGTRSKRDTRPEQIQNAKYYHDKWGTYQPPC